MSNLLPTTEVARQLKLSTRQVARLVVEGKLAPETKAPGKRGAYLFRPTVVKAYREQNEAA